MKEKIMLGYIQQSYDDTEKYFERQAREVIKFLKLGKFLKRFIWIVLAAGILCGILLWIFYDWGWGLFTIIVSVLFTYQFFFIFWPRKIEKKQRELFFNQK